MGHHWQLHKAMHDGIMVGIVGFQNIHACSGRQRTEEVLLLKVEAVTNDEAAVVAVGTPLVAHTDHSGNATAHGHRLGGNLSTTQSSFCRLLSDTTTTPGFPGVGPCLPSRQTWPSDNHNCTMVGYHCHHCYHCTNKRYQSNQQESCPSPLLL